MHWASGAVRIFALAVYWPVASTPPEIRIEPEPKVADALNESPNSPETVDQVPVPYV